MPASKAKLKKSKTPFSVGDGGNAPSPAIDYGPWELQMLAPADLIPTPDNKRVIHEDADSFKDFADSIRAQGVVVPVHARPHPDKRKRGKYDLRAGARRLRAATLVGLTEIPVIVHTQMSDRAAFELTLLENWEREDLTPFEESETVAGLLTVYEGDHAAVAARLGKTDRWVALRARLQHLGKAWRDELAVGNFDRWSAAHLDLIARFDESEQEFLLDELQYKESLGVRDLAEWIERHMLHRLDQMPWDIDDATLVKKAPACSACPQRSSCQGLLFAPEAGDADPVKSDRCLNVRCYSNKFMTWMTQRQQALKAEHPDALCVVTDHPDYQKRETLQTNFGVYSHVGDSWDPLQRCKKTDKGATPALVVYGTQLGKVIHVKKSSGNGGSSSSSSGSQKSGPTPLKDRRKALKSKRLAELLKQLIEKVEPVTFDDLKKIHGDMRGARIGRLVACIGTIRSERTAGDDAWAEYDKLPDVAPDAACRLWPRVREVLLARLRSGSPITQTPHHYEEESRRCADFCGIDWDELWTAACDVYKEPKSWAGLNEDGTPKTSTTKSTKATKNGNGKKPKKADVAQPALSRPNGPPPAVKKKKSKKPLPVFSSEQLAAARLLPRIDIPDGPSLLILQEADDILACWWISPAGETEKRLPKRDYPDRDELIDAIEDLQEYANAYGHDVINPVQEAQSSVASAKEEADA